MVDPSDGKNRPLKVHPITDIDVTYGSVLAANGFHRVCGLDGDPATLNVDNRVGNIWTIEEDLSNKKVNVNTTNDNSADSTSFV